MVKAKRKAIKKPVESPIKVGQKVMVAKPSEIHKNYHGAQGYVVSCKGFRVEVKFIVPDKQREFAISELQVL